MPPGELGFGRLDGAQAGGHGEELQALHAEVYADPPYPDSGGGGQAGFARRFAVQRRQPGFVLAEARHGGYLVGYATGLPLRPSTFSWWRGLTTPLPGEVTAEHPGRTFEVAELLVRASLARRQGIGRGLHDLELAGRPEERATLTVLPAAIPAQAAFQSWGLAQGGPPSATRSPARRCPATDSGARASWLASPVLDGPRDGQAVVRRAQAWVFRLAHSCRAAADQAVVRRAVARAPGRAPSGPLHRGWQTAGWAGPGPPRGTAARACTSSTCPDQQVARGVPAGELLDELLVLLSSISGRIPGGGHHVSRTSPSPERVATNEGARPRPPRPPAAQRPLPPPGPDAG